VAHVSAPRGLDLPEEGEAAEGEEGAEGEAGGEAGEAGEGRIRRGRVAALGPGGR